MSQVAEWEQSTHMCPSTEANVANVVDIDAKILHFAHGYAEPPSGKKDNRLQQIE